MDRQNIYFIFEYVERDLERYLKLHNPLPIDQIRVRPPVNVTSPDFNLWYSLEFHATTVNSGISAAQSFYFSSWYQASEYPSD